MLGLPNITREKIMKNLLVKFLKYLTKNERQAEICPIDPRQVIEEEKQSIIGLKQEVQEEPVKIEQPQDVPNLAHTEAVVFLPQVDFVSEVQKPQNDKITEKKTKKKPSKDIIEFDPRDMMEVMEVPFLALSKNRTEPIIYESRDGKIKVQVSAHRKHYVASIYDWDIILLVSSKMQEIINASSDIPPKTIIIPRHELLKSLHKHNGKKEEKDLKSSLARLKLTGIETTIPVSYTHLDVYKRQQIISVLFC